MTTKLDYNNMHNKKVGKKGEDIACAYLSIEGYAIIERNYKIKLGEIDIIAKDNNEIVFVEVKTRSSKKRGSGVESVTKQKIRHIENVSKMYVIQNSLYNYAIRFDVLDIDMGAVPYKINHIKRII